MTGSFVKHYPDPRRAAAAMAHRDWLAALDSGVLIPDARQVSPNDIEIDHLGHRHPGPDDLAALARTLGLLHSAAHRQHLHQAQLDTPFAATGGLVIVDFPTSRRRVLDRMPIPTAGLPAALYKDANIRNFLLTDQGPAIIDFDDLTLAPFGYDLAKLVVSTTMTHGHIDPDAIENALTTYNTHTATADNTACPTQRLRLYAEFHHLSTARYLRRNGYLHHWPDVRPWPAPPYRSDAQHT